MKRSIPVKKKNALQNVLPVDWDRHVVEVWKTYPFFIDGGGQLQGILLVGNPAYDEFEQLLKALPQGVVPEDPTKNPLRFMWQVYPEVQDPKYALLQFKIVNHSQRYLTCVIDLLTHYQLIENWPTDNNIELLYIPATDAQNITVEKLNAFRKIPNRLFQIALPLDAKVTKHLYNLERDLKFGKYTQL